MFATRDAERAMALLGDHLFENMDVFRTGGGASWIDVDLDGVGGDLVDDTAKDVLGVDVDDHGSSCSLTTSVGDVLVSFGIDLVGTGEDDLEDAPDGFRADTGGLADGDAESGDDTEATPESEYSTGADVGFDSEESAGDDQSVDRIYNEAMDNVFGDGSDTGSSFDSCSDLSHELWHVVQSQVRDTGWEGTWDGGLQSEICLPALAAEANINWNILGVSMYVQPDPTRSDEDLVEAADIAPIDLIGEALRFEANEAYLRDDSRWDTDPSPVRD